MTDDADFEQLRDRLEPDDGKRKKDQRRQPPIGKALGGLAAIGLAGTLLAYVLDASRGRQEETLETAEPEPWQGTGQGYETMSAPAGAEPAAAPLASVPEPIPAVLQPSQGPTLPAGPSEAEQEMMATLNALRQELDALRNAPSNGDEETTRDDGSDAQIDALTDQVATLTEQANQMRDEAREADTEARTQANAMRRLEAELEAAQGELHAAQFGPTGGPPVPLGEGVPLDLEAERLAALEERRAEAEDLRQARIDSPMVAFGGSVSPPDLTGGADAAGASGLGQNEDFLRAGARAADVEQAVVIANPSRTVIQGTVIQAAMETAIDSSLPGAIRAVVSEDVHSYDGTRVLIPRGSKLIGRYNSQVEATQRRIMVAWDRIITPDGQSVTISAYGADELGRSGTAGTIDRRLGTRFGSATLVSLISALPSAASAAVDDPLAAAVAEELGEGAEEAAGSVLDQYLSVPPTIYVDQGARITVMVDRDLELI